jgi:hypothetical protein
MVVIGPTTAGQAVASRMRWLIPQVVHSGLQIRPPETYWACVDHHTRCCSASERGAGLPRRRYFAGALSRHRTNRSSSADGRYPDW